MTDNTVAKYRQVHKDLKNVVSLIWPEYAGLEEEQRPYYISEKQAISLIKNMLDEFKEEGPHEE